MSTLFYVLLILAPAAILATAYAIIKKRNQGRSIKRSVAVNLATFAVLTVLIAALSVSVFAADDNNASAFGVIVRLPTPLLQPQLPRLLIIQRVWDFWLQAL